MEWGNTQGSNSTSLEASVAIPFSDPSSSLPQISAVPVVLQGYLRREELAEQFGLSTRTIDRWEALRQGPPRITVGRTILYNIDTVRDWLSAMESRPRSTPKRRPIKNSGNGRRS